MHHLVKIKKATESKPRNILEKNQESQEINFFFFETQPIDDSAAAIKHQK